MEYGKREPLASEPAPETTAFTMRTIQDILAETGDEGLLMQSAPAEAPSAAQVAAPPVAAPEETGLQTPPSAADFAAASAAAQAAADAASKAAAAAEQAAAAAHARIAVSAPAEPHPGSLGQRLANRLFSRA